MVEKIKSLNSYQKGVLVVMAAMMLVFAVIYIRTISRVGYEYNDAILVPSQENGSTVYSGKIQGEAAKFTVSEDKTVVLQYGNKTYGPYTAKEDPSAVPEDEDVPNNMTGVELRQGDEVLFRGGFLDTGSYYLLYNEDGTSESIKVTYVGSDGYERDENGKIVDPMEPSVSTILELMDDPELTHKGAGIVWFGAAFVCVINALLILFADEFFQLHLLFRIRNADGVEPSDLEIAGRYVGWTAVTIMALVIFITGLQ